MEIPVVYAERREALGTKAMRKLRADGRIPGVLYGQKKENLNLSFDYRSVEDLVKNEERVVEIEIEGDKQHALVRALQRDHFGDTLQHIDFVRVDLDDKVHLSIPLHFVGTPRGVSHGGMLEIVRSGLEAKLPARNIPKFIEVEVGQLEVDDFMRFKDLPLPEGAELLENSEGIVARCIKARRAAAIAAAAAAEVGAGPGAAGEPVPEGEAPPEGAAEGNGEDKGEPKPEKGGE